MNPLIPSAPDAVMSLTLLAHVVLAGLAVVRVRARGALRLGAVLWIVLVPIMGPVTWLVMVRRNRSGAQARGCSPSRKVAESGPVGWTRPPP